MSRDDCHSPANMDPADYKYVGWLYQGRSEYIWESINLRIDRDFIDPDKILRSKRLFDGNYKAKRTCDCCGAVFAWGSVYRHTPSNTIVVVGHICARKFNLLNKAALIRVQVERAAEAARKRAKIRKAAEEWLSTHPDLVELLGDEAEPEHQILKSLKNNLWNWGNLTEPQAALAYKLKQQEERREEMKEQWAEEAKNAEDVPTGSGIEITGVILSVKTKDGRYGIEYKMLVKDDRGFKVWGTHPTSLWDGGSEGYRGRRVRFIANVQRSKDDSKFGFFKRPRKAEYIEEVKAFSAGTKATYLKMLAVSNI